MPLTDMQIEYLRRPLNTQRVARRTDGNKNLSYLEAWDVKAHLTRIFGYGGWDSELTDYRLAFEREYTVERQNGVKEQMIEVCYTAKVTLVIRDKAGQFVCAYTEAAAGQANVKATSGSRGDAHDNALKQAESDALKRCAINLGTQFGLSLYDNGSTDDVIRWTLVRDPRAAGTEGQRPDDGDVPTVQTHEQAEENVAHSLGASKVEDAKALAEANLREAGL